MQYTSYIIYVISYAGLRPQFLKAGMAGLEKAAGFPGPVTPGIKGATLYGGRVSAGSARHTGLLASSLHISPPGGAAAAILTSQDGQA